MSVMYPAMVAFIEGLKTAIDHLSLDYEGNEFAKGYRAALDDIGNYLDEVESGIIEQRVIDERNRRTWNEDKEAGK